MARLQKELDLSAVLIDQPGMLPVSLEFLVNFSEDIWKIALTTHTKKLSTHQFFVKMMSKSCLAQIHACQTFSLTLFFC